MKTFKRHIAVIICLFGLFGGRMNAADNILFNISPEQKVVMEGALTSLGLRDEYQNYVDNFSKLMNLANLWKTKYTAGEMMEGRTFFEQIMREYRYTKAAGWGHTADIAHNFKGVDFYKGIEQGEKIYAETAVSMKTTITKDVNSWLKSEPIKKNIEFLEQGLTTRGLESNIKTMIIKNAEVHIYMPKENITSTLKAEWLNNLNAINPKIKFKIESLENFIK